MRLISLLALPGLMLGTAVAAADFVPGRYYAPRFPIDGSPGSEGIWEFDPLTGQSRLFADTQSFGAGVTGLTFTPDGQRLRASVRTTNSIVEFDSAGVGQVVLDSDDGISSPFGSNNLTYDQFGNFFVVNSFPSQILRFPPDGGAGTVLADPPSYGSIAPAPDGSLYIASTALFHVLTSGVLVEIDDEVAGWVATTRIGDLFVLDPRSGVYRYPQGDPDARQLLALPPPNSVPGSLAIAPDQATLVVLTFYRDFYSIDTTTGATTSLGGFPYADELFSGYGLAISVPEPTSLAFLLLGAILAARPRREQPGLTLAAARPQNFRVTAICSTKGVRLCS